MNQIAKITSPELNAGFERLSADYQRDGELSYARRISGLKALVKALTEHKQSIADAISRDFGHRVNEETRISEISNTIAHIDYAIANLHRWMRPRSRSTSIWFLPGSNSLSVQALGVVGILVPWNYPINLAVCGIATAIAAGNRCLVKMSELTPEADKVLQKIVAEVFPRQEVVVLGGDASVAAEFCKLPFDHLLFTGSCSVGKKVMAAAAENLTPVTLELGGKNPVIVADDYFIGDASLRMVWGKTYNAGQTCVAPDYALIPPESSEDLVVWMSRHYRELFPKGALSVDYTAIVNDDHFARLETMVNEARQAGARVVQMEPLDDEHRKQRKFPLTLLLEVPESCSVLHQEIFGPVLPLIEIGTLSSALEYIRARERPLALYCFSNSAKTRQTVAARTVSGGITFNDVMLQYLQPSLPFGGVGSSGFGAYHGEEGFKTLSHTKAIFRQRPINGFTGVKLLYPPYGMLARLVIKMMKG